MSVTETQPREMLDYSTPVLVDFAYMLSLVMMINWPYCNRSATLATAPAQVLRAKHSTNSAVVRKQYH